MSEYKVTVFLIVWNTVFLAFDTMYAATMGMTGQWVWLIAGTGAGAYMFWGLRWALHHRRELEREKADRRG
jgi:hypothetical protein